MKLGISECGRRALLGMAFEILGVLFGAGVFGSIALRDRVNGVSNVTVTQAMVDTERLNYMEGSCAVCIIFVLCTVTVLVGTKEKNDINEGKTESYFKGLRKILTFKPYLFLMFAFMFTSLGIQIIQNNLALYVIHVLILPSHVTPGIVTLLSSAFLMVPLGYKFMQIFGKKLIFFSGCLNLCPMLVTLVFLPSNLHVAIYYLYMIWVSYSLMIAMVLPWSMLPDVIDMFMIENGTRHEATFYSFYVFFNKFAVGIALSLSSAVLGFAGYKSGAPMQPESVSNMLRHFIAISGLFCFILSMVFLYFYPITEERRKLIALQLEDIRKQEEETAACYTTVDL